MEYNTDDKQEDIILTLVGIGAIVVIVKREGA